MTRSDRVRVDTLPAVAHTSAASVRSAASRGVCAALLFFCGLAPGARAEMRDLDARVIWSRSDLIYVASPDSGVLSLGMSLSIRRGPRELVRGHVERLHEPRLAVVRVTSGLLAGEDRLDELRVFREPGTDAWPASLRVGLPARARRNLLFGCDAPGVASLFAGEHYQVDTLTGGTLRMRRSITSPRVPLAPDTIEVAFFAEATDAEIALERGDLDVAVFWPGELSARMRTGDRAKHVFAGRRSRGLLACVRTAPDSLEVPPADLALLNRDGFAGDLEPWPRPGARESRTWAITRYRVDPSLPGARVLERVLTRVNRASATRTVELRYLDEPADAAPVPAESGAMAGPGSSPARFAGGIQPAFLVRCLVVTTERSHALVSTLGPGAFADLVVCGGASR